MIDWIEKNQLGRRNLTADARKLILGRRYNRQKKAVGGQLPREGVDQNEPAVSTAEKLAKENHVSPATVKRAGKFAADLVHDVIEGHMSLFSLIPDNRRRPTNPARPPSRPLRFVDNIPSPPSP